EKTLARLAEAGLLGLEVGHRENTESGKRMLRRLAERYELVMTGSSDYHGFGKPNRLAEFTTEEAVLERIIAEGTGSAPFLPLRLRRWAACCPRPCWDGGCGDADDAARRHRACPRPRAWRHSRHRCGHAGGGDRPRRHAPARAGRSHREPSQTHQRSPYAVHAPARDPRSED